MLGEWEQPRRLGRIFRIPAPGNRGMIGAGTGIISGTAFAPVYS